MALITTLTACTHVIYQFRPSGAEQTALDQATARFVAAANHDDFSALQGQVDLVARRALLQLAVKLGAHHTQAGRQAESAVLFAVLVLAVQAYVGATDAEDVQWVYDAFLSQAEEFRGKLQEELGVGLNAEELGGDAGVQAALTVLEARLQQSPEQRTARILAGIGPAPSGGGCQARRLVSYHGELLQHLGDDAPTHEPWRSWSRTVTALHLVEISCRDRAFAVLYAGDRLVFARQFAPSEWARARAWLNPRLER